MIIGYNNYNGFIVHYNIRIRRMTMKKLLSFVIASAMSLSSIGIANAGIFGLPSEGTVEVGLDTKISNSTVSYSDYNTESAPCVIYVSSSTSKGALNAKATIDMTEVKSKWNEYIGVAVGNGIPRATAVEYIDLSSSRFTLKVEADSKIKNSAGAGTVLNWSTKAQELFEPDGDATYTETDTKTTYTITMKIKATNQELDDYFTSGDMNDISVEILGSTVEGVNTVYRIDSTFSGTIVLDVPPSNDNSNQDMVITFNDTDVNYVKQVVTGGGSSRPKPTPTPTPTPSPSPTPEVPDELATTVEPQLQGTSTGAKLNYNDHYAYIIGYDNEDGTSVVRPENPITRAEVATIFYRLLDEESRNKFRTQECDFSDVNVGSWYNNNVATVAAAGIINGYEDGTFRPDKKITRAEFAAIAARFTSLTYEGEPLFGDTAGHWAEQAINNAAITGWVDGYEDGTFEPDSEITRAEAITLINRVLYRYIREENMHEGMVNWSDNTEDKWYYEAIQEATNSHDYDRKDIGYYEIHTAIESSYDWESHEK